ncbi:MAG: VOC family protein [Acidobacteriota bacterium]
MTSTSFMSINPVLPVRDLGASVRFYTEGLGFVFAFGDRGGSPLPDGPGAPGYAGVTRGSVELHLQWQDESEFTKGTVGLAMLRILVADLDSMFEEYRETGLVDSRTQIRQTSWETREFHERDLDGHGLTYYCDL